MMRRPRVLIVRPAEDALALADRLQALGMEPVVVPAVAILPPVSWDPVDGALHRLASYDWVLFTSANGVRMLFARLATLGLPRPLPAVRWAAIGPGTASALVRHGIPAPWTPSRYLGEAVGAELPIAPAQRVLRIRVEAASPAATLQLRARGVWVDEVVAYRIAEAPPESEALLRRASSEGFDAIVFTSASTVRGFAHLAERVGMDDDLGGVFVFAIGPVTARAVRERGWHVDAIASQYSVDGLVQAIDERRTSLVAGQAPS